MGSGGSDFIITKLADDAPVRRNLIETPGDNPGVNELVKSAAGPILIKPVIFPPALRSPVNGESKKIYTYQNNNYLEPIASNLGVNTVATVIKLILHCKSYHLKHQL